MLACMKKERQARRDLSLKNSRERQELIRERVKNDKTDYDELLKQFREQKNSKFTN